MPQRRSHLLAVVGEDLCVVCAALEGLKSCKLDSEEFLSMILSLRVSKVFPAGCPRFRFWNLG
jgi:hypothetical protein